MFSHFPLHWAVKIVERNDRRDPEAYRWGDSKNILFRSLQTPTSAVARTLRAVLKSRLKLAGRKFYLMSVATIQHNIEEEFRQARQHFPPHNVQKAKSSCLAECLHQLNC